MLFILWLMPLATVLSVFSCADPQFDDGREEAGAATGCENAAPCTCLAGTGDDAAFASYNVTRPGLQGVGESPEKIQKKALYPGMPSPELAGFAFAAMSLPLYVRISKNEVLDNKTRGRIKKWVFKAPGIHFNEIMRRLRLGNGETAHHLTTLEREGFVWSRSDGRLRRFYPREMAHLEAPPSLSRTEKSILETVQENEGISQGEISKLLEIPYATINRHVNKLADAGFLRLERHGMTIKCFRANGNQPENAGGQMR
jgi:DNA-binding MarR family transcriptional regulator